MKIGGLRLVESVTSEGHRHSVFVLEHASGDEHRGVLPHGSTSSNNNSNSSSNNNSINSSSTNNNTSSGLVDLNALAGRLRKFMGDVCLQLCAPVDALAHYAAAILACKTVPDPLWQAAAMEGYAAAVLILLDQSPSETVLHDTLGQVTPPGTSLYINTSPCN